MTVEIKTGIAIPEKGYQPRTEASRKAVAMQPGDVAICSTVSEAYCVRQALIYLKHKAVMKKLNGSWYVWRKE